MNTRFSLSLGLITAGLNKKTDSDVAGRTISVSFFKSGSDAADSENQICSGVLSSIILAWSAWSQSSRVRESDNFVHHLPRAMSKVGTSGMYL